MALSMGDLFSLVVVLALVMLKLGRVCFFFWDVFLLRREMAGRMMTIEKGNWVLLRVPLTVYQYLGKSTFSGWKTVYAKS
ncbi:hypothetical protein QBC37DRAFT_408946 [Rhypophila decipiens]|uniref:Uncharacterized protein n=1 Tax=Rhypophila decipiens TaxID=261697 RepID=A0AAN6YIL6_9PEZI|nr:hypothetical protein QBC37DRAFT_408946 [Rhypophila decipiens]